jgi:hypothetical protein
MIIVDEKKKVEKTSARHVFLFSFFLFDLYLSVYTYVNCSYRLIKSIMFKIKCIMNKSSSNGTSIKSVIFIVIHPQFI